MEITVGETTVNITVDDAKELRNKLNEVLCIEEKQLQEKEYADALDKLKREMRVPGYPKEWNVMPYYGPIQVWW